MNYSILYWAWVAHYERGPLSGAMARTKARHKANELFFDLDQMGWIPR